MSGRVGQPTSAAGDGAALGLKLEILLAVSLFDSVSVLIRTLNKSSNLK